MLVYTKDVQTLINDGITKYQEKSGKLFGEPSIMEFFESMIGMVNSEQKVKLNSDTFYKHYYIKIKSHTSSEVGYSVNYLNALSNFAYNLDYLDKFERVIEDEDEIPEFPSHHPCFPATPAIKINGIKNIDGVEFSNLWVKDESFNPTGSHKDRKAHELYLFYDKIAKNSMSNNERIKLPRLSMISSGYAAIALQHRLYDAGLPNLKVLHDKKIDIEILEALKKLNAETYSTDLTSKKLSSEEIKELTNNPEGEDLTDGNNIALHLSGQYYDWLSYECLNLNPNWIFIPYGSGELFKNIVEIHAKEIKSRSNSKRYFGNKEILKKCNFIGVKPKDHSRKSTFRCLVSYYNIDEVDDITNLYKFCGAKTGIYEVLDKKSIIDKALDILQGVTHLKPEASGVAGLIYLLQLSNSTTINNHRNFEIDPKDKILIINTGTLNPKFL